MLYDEMMEKFIIWPEKGDVKKNRLSNLGV